MLFSGLDHVEFYVGDVHQSAFFLTTAFGFRVVGHAGPETGLTGERSLLLAQGDIRLMLTSGLAPGHRATEYVRVHGDGVAVLALGVPDAREAYETSISRGAVSIEEPRVYERGDARVVTAAVNAFGDVTLTLIEPVLSRKPGQIDDFLARHGGAGVQHLAFLTDDIVEAVGSLEQRGVRFLHTPDSYYEQLGQRVGIADSVVEDLREVRVLVDRDHWGKVFQIFTQAIYARHTFFVEVISRDGARTFGSGNIKALYEAVEREQVAV
jgi:4-hydroxyphenylpyruvate dioxygenase-like putative hemolysin